MAEPVGEFSDRVVVVTGASQESTIVNMQESPPIEGGFQSLGVFSIQPGEESYVEVISNGGGNVHADAIQLIPVAGK